MENIPITPEEIEYIKNKKEEAFVFLGLTSAISKGNIDHNAAISTYADITKKYNLKDWVALTSSISSIAYSIISNISKTAGFDPDEVLSNASIINRAIDENDNK